MVRVCRAFDAGLTWQPIDAVTPTLGCLLKSQGSDVLYGCGNPYDGGDFVLARSENFGQTWTPASNDSKALVIARIVHEMGALICVVVAVVQAMRRHVGNDNVMWPPACYEDAQPESDSGHGTVADAGGSNVEPRGDASESVDLRGDDARVDSVWLIKAHLSALARRHRRCNRSGKGVRRCPLIHRINYSSYLGCS